METQGHQEPREARAKSKGAAALCRAFMEGQGWLGLFRIANGEPHKYWAKKAFGGSEEVCLTPDFDSRLAAYRLITSYGYGKPAELASSDDSGRSVTDALLESLRASGQMAK